MVKSTFLLATAASLYLASSVTAQATPTSIDLNSIAAEASSIAASIMSNPGAVSSLISQASSAVSLLPSEYQGSAASAIAAASSSYAAIEGSKSDAPSSYKPLGVVALIATVAGAAILM